MIINITKFVSMLAVAFYACISAHATTYYIAVNGNDAAVGTQSHPFKTIQRGADAARAGDTVLVTPGIYYERAINIRNGGTRAAPVTIRAAGGGKSIIDHGLRVASWMAATGPLFSGQAIFTPRDSAATNTIERVVIDGRAYRKVADTASVTQGSFAAAKTTGIITIWPIDGASPNNRDVLILSESTDYIPGLYIWDNGRGGPVNNIILDGLVHRAANTAIWGARFIQNPLPGAVGRNITIKNCEIVFNWQYALRLDNWNGATMQNCDVHENGQVNWPRGERNVVWPHSIIGYNGNFVNILDSKIHDNHGEGVGPFTDCAYWVIRNNEVYDNYSVNIYVDTNIGNVIVDKNLVYLTGKYVAVGAFGNSKLQNSDGIRIANELADLSHGDATPFINNIQVTNNIVINTGDGIMSFPYADSRGVVGPSGLRNSLIANNTVVTRYTGQGGFQTGINVSIGDRVTVANNISYPQKIHLATGGTGGVTAANNLVADPSSLETSARVVLSKNIFGMPGFTRGIGFMAQDYTLATGSPAIDKGRTIAVIKTDYAGTNRPQGAAYDIGAFER